MTRWGRGHAGGEQALGVVRHAGWFGAGRARRVVQRRTWTDPWHRRRVRLGQERLGADDRRTDPGRDRPSERSGAVRGVEPVDDDFRRAALDPRCPHRHGLPGPALESPPVLPRRLAGGRAAPRARQDDEQTRGAEPDGRAARAGRASPSRHGASTTTRISSRAGCASA